jgi:hypothetical protein
MAEKNLVEEALLQMENLQEAITNNAKGILASTMKQEISELVKESLSDKDEIEISDVEMSEQEEEEFDTDIDTEVEDEGEEGLEDLDTPSDNEDDEEFEMGDEEMLMTDLPNDDLNVDGEEEVLSPLDLTSASDEEVLKVFKAMGEEDGIIVKQDDNEIRLSDDNSDTEYVIQLGESEEEMAEGDYMDEEEEEEVMYEIEMDDDEVSDEEMLEGDYEDDEEDIVYEIEVEDDEVSDEEEESEYEETKESSSSRSLASRRMKTKSSTEPTKKYGKNRFRPAQQNESLERELAQLREKNEEYRKALSIFKEKLNEVAVFNSNLAYATRLFTEHSTTKQEKINILRRFDSVENLKESKSLYKTIKEDLGGKETNIMTESVQSKVQKTPTKGSANNLIESKTYENPQFLRMKDLMNKLK